MKVVVIAAHADDEVLGCGGTIALHSERGDDVCVLIVGDGVSSRYIGDRSEVEEAISRRRMQSEEAGRILGVKEVINVGLPDNILDAIPVLEVAREVQKHVNAIDPEVVYTHHAGDLNQDHAVVNRASLIATRPVDDCGIVEVLTYEVMSSTEWGFGEYWPRFEPNVFVDISPSLEKKLRAMQVYEDEVRDWPHPRSCEGIVAVALRWGASAGMEKAEVFHLVRSMRRLWVGG